MIAKTLSQRVKEEILYQWSRSKREDDHLFCNQLNNSLISPVFSILKHNCTGTRNTFLRWQSYFTHTSLISLVIYFHHTIIIEIAMTLHLDHLEIILELHWNCKFFYNCTQILICHHLTIIPTLRFDFIERTLS